MIKLPELFLITSLFIASTAAYARNSDEDVDPADHMALATLMLYDGNFDKALTELKLVDTEKKGFDFARYYTIKGIVSMRVEDYNSAIENLKLAIEATRVKVYKKIKGVDSEVVRTEKLGQLQLQLAEAYYRVKDYASVIETLDAAGEAGVARPELFSLRADCYWRLEDHGNAFDVLSRGFERFPEEVSFVKQKFFYFADLGLYLSAVEAADRYFQAAESDAKDSIAFAQVLSGAHEDDKAIRLLEKAKLQFPKNAKIPVLLGHLYLRRDMHNVAANLFEYASYFDKKYVPEAAEVYRRAKDFPDSLRLNARITDPKEKAKQQVAIFVEQGEFERIIALKDELRRYDMLRDDNLRYALAYAYYMVKDYDNAEKNLKKLTNSELFAKATVIRKSIERCKDNELECL
ncbi:MAG: tetratricopeptide repeat protein [Thiotrichales bacterium]